MPSELEVHSSKPLSDEKAMKKIQKFLKQSSANAEENGAKLNDDIAHQLSLIAAAIRDGPVAPVDDASRSGGGI